MNTKKTVAMFLVSTVAFSCLLSLPAFASEKQPITQLQSVNVSVSPRANSFVWKYKIVNGEKYRRLWNETKGCWAGEWEKL